MFKLPNKLENKERFSYFESFTDTIQINPTGEIIIYYLHGGAFAFEMDLYYYDFFERLATTVNAHIIIPIYPKTKKATYTEIHRMVKERYAYVVSNYANKEIIIMGDSAGGNLCFILSLSELTPPSKMITISPWLDLSTSNTEMKKIEPFDPFLNIDMLQKFANLYAPNIDLKSKEISPLYANLSKLKQTYILMGTNDILYADYLILKEKYPHIKCFTFKNHIHCFALLKENQDGFNTIVSIIKKDSRII